MTASAATSSLRHNPRAVRGARRALRAYFPPEEHAELKLRAHATGVSMSRYLLRGALDQLIDPPVLVKDAEPLIVGIAARFSETKPVAVRVNELARHANTHTELHADTLGTVAAAVAASDKVGELLRRYTVDPAEEHESVDFYDDAANPKRGQVAHSPKRPVGSAPLKHATVLVSADEQWKLEMRAKAKRKPIARLLRDSAFADRSNAMNPGQAERISRQLRYVSAQLAGCAVNVQQMLRHTSDTSTATKLRAAVDQISVTLEDAWELTDRLAQ